MPPCGSGSSDTKVRGLSSRQLRFWEGHNDVVVAPHIFKRLEQGHMEFEIDIDMTPELQYEFARIELEIGSDDIEAIPIGRIDGFLEG